MADPAGSGFEDFEQEQLFDEQQDAVIDTPCGKVPVGAVPDAGQQPDNADVDELTADAAAVAAEGNVDIFLKPGTLSQ